LPFQIKARIVRLEQDRPQSVIFRYKSQESVVAGERNQLYLLLRAAA
jgi:hypothetical protein